MGWQTLIPLLQVLEQDVNDHLERDDNDTLQEVEHEVLDLNAVVRGDDGLLIVDPNEHGKEGLVDQGQRVGAEA